MALQAGILWQQARAAALKKKQWILAPANIWTAVQSPWTQVVPWQQVAGTAGWPTGDIAMAWLAKPTVATPQQPVMDRGVQTGFQMPDYSWLEAMDKKWLQDYLDSIDIRNMTGEKIATDELLKARRAARMLQEQSAVWQVNPNEQILADLQAQKEAEAARLWQQNTQQFDTYRQQIEAQAEQTRRRIEQQAQKQQQAMQSWLSFSWFGRSTVAVEKGNEIQQNVSDALSAMELANQAELQRYQAELQGATAEQLAQYDNQIRNYQLQASQWEADSIQKTNELNQSLWLTYEQKINNLLEAATQTAKTYEDLTEAEQQAIMWYAGVILDDKWNIDSDVLKSIPAGLSAYVINEAAKLRWSLPWEAAKVINAGTAKNPNYLQRNPETGTYDIPVGSMRGTGWGGTWGVGWMGWGWMWQQQIGTVWQWSALDLIDYNVKFKNIDQSNSFNYATRMIEASDVFNQLEKDIAWMSTAEYIYQKSLWALPYGSSLQNDVVQQQEQAERNFVNAVLRKESWATISKEEFTNAQKQYLPQPWDSAAVLEQKRKNRETALKGISAATGNQKSLAPAINAVAQKKQEKPQSKSTLNADKIRDFSTEAKRQWATDAEIKAYIAANAAQFR